MPYTVCPCRSVRLSMSLLHTPPCRTLSAPVGLYVCLCLFLTHRHAVHCLPLSVCTSVYVSSSHTAMPYTVCPCRSVRLSMSLPHTPPCRTLSAPVGLYVCLCLFLTHRHAVHCLPLSVCTSVYVSSSHTAMPYTVCPCRSVRLSMSLPHTPPCRTLSAPVGLYVCLCLFLTHRHAVHCLPLSVCTSVYVSSSHATISRSFCLCRSVCLSV